MHHFKTRLSLLVVSLTLLCLRTTLAEDLCQDYKPQTLAQLKNQPTEFPERKAQSFEFDGKNYIEVAGFDGKSSISNLIEPSYDAP